VKRQQALV